MPHSNSSLSSSNPVAQWEVVQIVQRERASKQKLQKALCTLCVRAKVLHIAATFVCALGVAATAIGLGGPTLSLCVTLAHSSLHICPPRAQFVQLACHVPLGG